MNIRKTKFLKGEMKMKLQASQWGVLQNVDYNTYQNMTEEEKEVIKKNFTYGGGEWVLKRDFDRNAVTIVLDDWAKRRVDRFARRGKTAEEIAEMFDRVDDFLKEDVANAIKEYMKEGN